MNILEQYLAELDKIQFNQDTAIVVDLDEAKDLLQRFEIALINSLDCDELLKRQGWKEAGSY